MSWFKYSGKKEPISSRENPKVVCVKSLVPKDKKSACLAIKLAIRHARGNSIIVPILILLVFCVRLSAEDYRIYLLGIPIVNVSMESSSNNLSFHTETLGLIHSIWPVDNYYFTQLVTHFMQFDCFYIMFMNCWPKTILKLTTIN